MKHLIKPWRWPDESQPDPLEDVLVITCTGCLGDAPARDQAYRRKDGRWVLTGSDPEIVIVPLCWMPMPEIPQVFKNITENSK